MGPLKQVAEASLKRLKVDAIDSSKVKLEGARYSKFHEQLVGR
jgi:hypothetical protein